ncbi:hypothetical protein FNV43_RR24243 [Rhamnella rubrinervis]|uniref:DUF7610 domain-containing protein n=1 Tax=Rhamnella rubrinervis TaxID=2594499 RepID=A0A8K0DQS7_9ROSA|nr:hypothetical protein FNV43_RR24243 [Rhamnella rubrinervis]
MTKRYSILQKKLQELDSQLVNICSLQADPPITHRLLAQDFEQRLVFLQNLLSAEIASHPTKPHHLNHMSRRLQYIESTFRDWDSTGPTALHHVDNASTCSCTESCLNDDGEVLSPDDDDGLGSPVDSQGNFLEDRALVEYSMGSVENKAVPVLEFSRCLVEEVDKGKGERVTRKEFEAGSTRVGGALLCGAVTTGMVLGIALTSLCMLLFSGGFPYAIDADHFLTPT